MHLSYEQGNLFFDVMDSLLLYVNSRFHVVEDFDLDDDDPLLELKISLVTSFLWENLQVIEDYAADAPGLTSREQRLVLSWRYPLQDTFTLIRYQDGCALMMSDAGVFKVCGIVDDFDDSAGRVPALVRAVLLPFEDVIVYDGFLSMSDVPFNQERQLQDRFEHLIAEHGVSSSGGELIASARAIYEQKVTSELDEFISGLSSGSTAPDVEAVPQGFHRGALAGASEYEREQLVASRSASPASSNPVQQLMGRSWEHEPVKSLSECLELFPQSKLYEAAQSLDIRGYRHMGSGLLRKELAKSLLAYPEDFQDALLWCEDVQFDSARLISRQRSLSFSEAEAGRFQSVWPLLPYIFLFHWNGMFTLSVPDEVADLISQIDFDAFAQTRADYLRALSCAVACIVYSGIISVGDAYTQYSHVVAEPLSLEDFKKLVNSEASYGDLSFETWEFEGTTYLVHYTLCDDYIAQQMVQQHASVSVPQFSKAGRIDSASYQTAINDLRRGIGKEMDNAQSIRLSLLDSHDRMAMKPLDPVMAERDAYEVLCECESVRALRDYLDERVPDGEDDYTFADRAVQGIVATAVEVGDRQALLSYVQEIGLSNCSNDQQRFEAMLMRVFDDMPSWEHNGWTVREITERLTGRHVFYDADGRPMRVGVNDPCPCGSGKKYGDCHGRRN